MTDFRSEISKAKGSGSAKSGLKHYIMQRVTAIALIPLCMWFVVSAILLMQAPIDRIPEFVVSPMNLFAIILFIIVSLYHGALGMQVVIEDYVHCKAMKYSLIIGVYFLCIVSAIAGTCSAFGMHMFFIIKLIG